MELSDRSNLLRFPNPKSGGDPVSALSDNLGKIFDPDLVCFDCQPTPEMDQSLNKKMKMQPLSGKWYSPIPVHTFLDPGCSAEHPHLTQATEHPY